MMTRTISSRQSVSRNRNLRQYRARSLVLGPISMTVVLAIIVALTALMYLTQITKTSSYGYQVSELETTNAETADENQALAVEAARLRSIDRIKQSEISKSLVAEDQVTFLPASPPAQ